MDGFSTRYEDADDTLCYAVVRAVTAVTNEDPTAVDPLYDVVDPEALEAVVGSLPERRERAVSFSYNGCRVEIDGDGEIRVAPIDETG